MGLFEIIKNKLLNNNKTNTDQNNSDTIRIIHIEMALYQGYDTNRVMQNVQYTHTNPYKIPEGMTIDEACKVVSYLVGECNKKINFDDSKSNTYMCKLLENYQFTKLPEPQEGFHISEYIYSPNRKHNFDFHKDGITDLIKFFGSDQAFDNTNLNKYYFDWYTPNVAKKDIQEIYDRINLPLEQPTTEETSM